MILARVLFSSFSFPFSPLSCLLSFLAMEDLCRSALTEDVFIGSNEVPAVFNNNRTLLFLRYIMCFSSSFSLEWNVEKYANSQFPFLYYDKWFSYLIRLTTLLRFLYSHLNKISRRAYFARVFCWITWVHMNSCFLVAVEVLPDATLATSTS